RDIELLKQVEAKAGDQITVLDVSLDKNREALEQVLAAGAEVYYADHHFAGDIPESENLTASINTAPDVCTSILVNSRLRGAFLEWAVVGTFGDNLYDSAHQLAKPLELDEAALLLLKNLGTYINYNGYGSDLSDLHFEPAQLYRLVSPYANPIDFVQGSHAEFEKLEEGYRADMAAAEALRPLQANDHTAVFVLPNEPWARRVSGVYSNDLANASPARGHAVLTEKANGNYLVSVRAPLENKIGADELCRRFPTGGGRKAAAGINDLPADMLDEFLSEFNVVYSQGG
ncbi:MAG: DHH family phosphoesterase, partial [Gammaproteobacteria bacterium]|nr:DHH family phosphoesterase [Gammaproteobacteria bacterium]